MQLQVKCFNYYCEICVYVYCSEIVDMCCEIMYSKR